MSEVSKGESIKSEIEVIEQINTETAKSFTNESHDQGA